MVRAAQQYDPTKGASFQTYAFNKMTFGLRNYRRETSAQEGWSRTPTKKELKQGDVKASDMVRRLRFSQFPVNEAGESMEELLAITEVDHDSDIDTRQKIQIALSQVSDPRDAFVLKGLLTGQSQGAIAEALGVTRQRVHQLVERIIPMVTTKVQGLMRQDV